MSLFYPVAILTRRYDASTPLDPREFLSRIGTDQYKESVVDPPGIIVFASGTKRGGGSGFEALVKAERMGILRAHILAVVSNHSHGGVYRRAKRLGIPFILMKAPFTGAAYFEIFRSRGAELAVLSGWLKVVKGLWWKRTINVHPAPLPAFGGKGMYGRNLHAAVLRVYRRRIIKTSALTIHYVGKRYDEGPIIAEVPVSIYARDTVATLEARMKKVEHFIYPLVINQVLYTLAAA